MKGISNQLPSLARQVFFHQVSPVTLVVSVVAIVMTVATAALGFIKRGADARVRSLQGRLQQVERERNNLRTVLQQAQMRCGAAEARVRELEAQPRHALLAVGEPVAALAARVEEAQQAPNVAQPKPPSPTLRQRAENLWGQFRNRLAHPN